MKPEISLSLYKYIPSPRRLTLTISLSRAKSPLSVVTLYHTYSPVTPDFKMKPTAALPILAASIASVTATPLEERQSCPGVYVFGARETTVGPGYGSAGALVNMVTAAYSGSQASAITYPACGGQSSCGGISYDNSATQGTSAVVSAVTSLNSRCPNTKIVLIGYSQVCIRIHI
jgi:hypothetical protein